MPTLKVAASVPEAFEFLWTPSRYKAAHGGRGGAKSHSFAEALLVKGLNKPLRWLCAREIQKSISTSVKQLLDDKIAKLGLGGFYQSTDRSIKSILGGELLFAGLRTNPDNIRSMEGLDGAWVEEAHSVSQTSLDMLTPTVLRKEDAEIWFSWNRRLASDPVDNLFLGGEPPPNSIVRKVGWRDNPWFPKPLWDEMAWLKRRDRDKWRHVWEGELLQRSQSRVFNNWTEDDLDELVLADAVPRLGADWGFSVDPSVLIEAYLIGERTLYFRDEAWKIGCEIDELPALFAGTDVNDPERWANSHGHAGVEAAKRHAIIADSSRPDTISYMRKRGFNIKGAVKGANSVEEGVEFMKSFDIVAHPRCVHVIDELQTYSYKIDPLTDNVLPILADRKNHTIDSCRYALEGVRRKTRGVIAVNGAEIVEL